MMKETYPTPPALPHLLFGDDDPDRRLARNPSLQRVIRNAYLPEQPPDLPHWRAQQTATLVRAVAIMRVIPSTDFLMGETAALIHGLNSLNREPDIVVGVKRGHQHPPKQLAPLPLGKHRGRPVLMRRSVRAVASEDIVTVNGLPVTSLARTAIDCALDLPPRKSLPIIDSALRAMVQPRRDLKGVGILENERVAEAREELEEVLSACGSCRGVRRARAVITLADPYAESPGESVLRWAAAASGLPLPESQQEVLLDGRYAYIDLAYPEAEVAWEFDGLGKYASTQDLHAEKLRQHRLEVEGWKVHRFVWEDLHDTPRLMARLRSSLPAPLTAHGIRRPFLV